MNAEHYPIIAGPDKPLDEITGEDDLVKVICMMLGEAEENAAQEIRTADRNWEYLKGNQFLSQNEMGDWITDTSNPYWRLRLQRDIILPVVSTSLAVLHKLRPKIIIEADFPDRPVTIYEDGQHIPLPISGSETAMRMDKAIAAEWDRRAEEQRQAEVLIDCMVTGNAFRYYGLKHQNHGKYGTTVEIRPHLLRRSQFLGDPNGSDMATFDDFKFIIIEQMMDVADIERIYNVKESDFAKSDGEGQSYGPEQVGLYRRYYSNWKSGGKVGTKYREPVISTHRRMYPVHTIYYNQGTPDVMAYGDKPPKSLRYPLGRQVVMVNKQKIVVDRHNPHWHGRFPITCYQTMPLPHFGGGFSDITPLIDIQNMVNILQNMIVTNAMVLGVPQWLVEEDAVKVGDITNEPGAIITVRPGGIAGTAIQRIEPGTIGGEIYTILRDLQAYGMEDLGDVSEALQGKNLGGNASGVYANTLLGAALTKQGFRGQMLDVAHKRSAMIEVSMMQQFMDMDRGYIEVNKDLGELVDIEEMWEMNLAMRDLFWSVSVESQADLPHNPSARANLGMAYLQAGIFDIQEFLLFTGLQVRPELRAQLEALSDKFIPGIPHDQQAQLIMQLEQAKANLQAQQGAIQGGGQQALPAPSGGDITGQSGADIGRPAGVKPGDPVL